MLLYLSCLLSTADMHHSQPLFMERYVCLQAVNHPYLVIYSPSGSNAAEQYQKALAAKTAAGLCPICHDPFEVLTLITEAMCPTPCRKYFRSLQACHCSV